jgi:hypothetical protein
MVTSYSQKSDGTVIGAAPIEITARRGLAKKRRTTVKMSGADAERFGDSAACHSRHARDRCSTARSTPDMSLDCANVASRCLDRNRTSRGCSS